MPDIQLTQPTTAEPRPSLPKRGTYEERRKAEVMCCNITLQRELQQGEGHFERWYAMPQHGLSKRKERQRSCS